jgi:hypothetical protein
MIRNEDDVICLGCGEPAFFCECEPDEPDDEPLYDDMGETDYDGDG